jgi:hypothetical protein
MNIFFFEGETVRENPYYVVFTYYIFLKRKAAQKNVPMKKEKGDVQREAS